MKQKVKIKITYWVAEALLVCSLFFVSIFGLIVTSIGFKSEVKSFLAIVSLGVAIASGLLSFKLYRKL